VSGALSAFFVTLVNAAMNHPVGFTMRDGRPADIDPIAAMWSPAWPHETAHTLLACYQSTAFVLAGIHALVLLRHPGNALFRKALAVTLGIACVTALAQPIVGDLAARAIAVDQPVKLAASEAHFETGPRAPIYLGGLPDVEARDVSFGLKIPSGLSILAFHDPDAVVKGLDSVPRDEWPPVAAVHICFQIMILAGSAMALLAVITAILAWRKKGLPDSRFFLWCVVAASPLGVIAMEAGWMVTELGRQPWIVYGIMRTRDAVTPFPHLAAPFWMFTLVYLFLGVAVVYLLFRQLRVASGEIPDSVAPPTIPGAEGGEDDAH
jgi:cytochrome d ubiquinol oxidase subunit I